VDKWWKKFDLFFIHRESTGGGHIVGNILTGNCIYKSLILLWFAMLCTGKAALNNNNKISISNIY